MLAAGERVRVRWSGKSGRVLRPRMPREVGDDHAPGVLVLLDPFTTRWRSAQVTICNLEVIYDPADLIIAEPPGSRR
jgi:hypothetical protein